MKQPCPAPDPQFDEKIKDICEVYLSAIERAERGERTISMDEMTGIQALEMDLFGQSIEAIINGRLTPAYLY